MRRWVAPCKVVPGGVRGWQGLVIYPGDEASYSGHLTTERLILEALRPVQTIFHQKQNRPQRHRKDQTPFAHILPALIPKPRRIHQGPAPPTTRSGSPRGSAHKKYIKAKPQLLHGKEGEAKLTDQQQEQHLETETWPPSPLGLHFGHWHALFLARAQFFRPGEPVLQHPVVGHLDHIPVVLQLLLRRATLLRPLPFRNHVHK